MGYPVIDRAINRMIDDAALANPMPHKIARKAGLRPTEATTEATSLAVRSLVDAWIIPDEEPFCYQWLVDLSPFEKIRLTCQASPNLVDILYSTTLTGDLNPGDYAQLLNLRDGAEFEEVGDDLFWTPIPDELRVEMRIVVSYSGEFSVPPRRVDGPFSLSIQVF